MTNLVKFNNDPFLNAFFGNSGNGFNHSGFKPLVNITETEDDFAIDINAAGYKKDQFDIKIDNDLLIISASVKKENTSNQFNRKEFSVKAFKRSFNISDTIDNEKIEASYENGILKVTLPKKEEAKPKAVTVIKVK